MTVFVNLHEVPPGCHMYTLYVTNCAISCRVEWRTADEIDVVASTNLSPLEIVEKVDLKEQGYEDCRVIGLVDQSIGEILLENWEGVKAA